MMIGNLPGFLAFAVAFGSASAITWSMGQVNDDILMMIAGPLLIVIDLGYRGFANLAFLSRRVGALLFFLPAWVWGALWAALGAVRHFAG